MITAHRFQYKIGTIRYLDGNAGYNALLTLFWVFIVARVPLHTLDCGN